VTLSLAICIALLACLQGLLVALPKPSALSRLDRLRSPAWAAMPAAVIVFGTFLPLAFPPIAPVLVLLAMCGAPLLLVVAVLAVARGPRGALVATVLLLTAVAALLTGWIGQVSQSVLTGLASLTLGVAVVRLTPHRLVLVGVLTMCLLDFALLRTGVGTSAWVTMDTATHHFHGPAFDRAAIGSVTIDYPDLVLAAMLGAFVAPHPRLQRQAALLLTMLALAYGLFLPMGLYPGTVPIALTFLVLELMRIRTRGGIRAVVPAPAEAGPPPLRARRRSLSPQSAASGLTPRASAP
jgi:hypothetical protein